MFTARELAAPRCLFGDSVPRTSDSRLHALREFGPFDSKNVEHSPRLLFVFPDEFRSLANDLFRLIVSGNTRFPGMKGLFDVAFDRNNLMRAPKFSTLGLNNAEASASYQRSIDEFFDAGNAADIAIVLCSKTDHREAPSPYYSSKVALARRGVPSQVVTADLLRNPNQSEWAIGDIALQVFVKLGGQPWSVVPSSGAGDVILGVGRSQRRNPVTDAVQTYVGFTTCFSAGGKFESIEVFKPQPTYEAYIAGLEESVVDAVSRILKDAKDPVHLVLHVPKRFSNRERTSVERALKAVQKDVAIQYTVLRIMDEHPFQVFDLSHVSFAPCAGLSVELDDRNRLLIVGGRPARGHMRRPSAGPLWITLQQSSLGDVRLEALVRQLYELSAASWRKFATGARPITTHYSKLLSEILATADDDSVQALASKAHLRAVPWFI